MKRSARFMALTGILGGLVLSVCGCRSFGGTPQKTTRQPQIKLPYVVLARAENAVSMPDADRTDAIVTTISRDGAIYLGSNRIELNDLGIRVRDLRLDNVEKQVYIRADARAQFRTVEEVIDSLRAADVEYVGLLVRKWNSDVQPSGNELPKYSTGLGLIVLSPSVLKKHFAGRLPDSIDEVQILYQATGLPAYKINQTSVQKAELMPKLIEIYKNRAERVLFIRGDGDLNFVSVAEVIDLAKGADVDHVTVLTPKMLADH